MSKPNFRVEASESKKGPPFFRVKRHYKVNVATEEQIKFIHSKSNVQNVFGVDISYASKVPPIGAPNAQLTPAAIPIATN